MAAHGSKRTGLALAAVSAILALLAPAAASELRGTLPLRLEAKPDQRPRMAVVIDDLGLDWRRFEASNGLPIPLTLAILPYGIEAQAMADAAASHHEVILHMPMEPYRRKADAGPDMVRPGDDAAVRRAVMANLAKLGGYRGVSNHTGSRTTASRSAMRIVLGELAGRNLYFLDNKTTPQSVAAGLAAETGASVIEADLFLDGDFGRGGSRHATQQLDRAARIARERGYAIVIGHPYPTTLAALERWTADHSVDFDFVRVRDIVAAGSLPAVARGSPAPQDGTPRGSPGFSLRIHHAPPADRCHGRCPPLPGRAPLRP